MAKLETFKVSPDGKYLEIATNGVDCEIDSVELKVEYSEDGKSFKLNFYSLEIPQPTECIENEPIITEERLTKRSISFYLGSAANAANSIISTGDGTFKFHILDATNSISVDNQLCVFGDDSERYTYHYRLKLGGRTSLNKRFTIHTDYPGILSLFVRSSKNTATNRNIILILNDLEIYNEIVKDEDAITINDEKVYPIINVLVNAGDISLQSPVDSINIYGLRMQPIIIHETEVEPTCTYEDLSIITEIKDIPCFYNKVYPAIYTLTINTCNDNLVGVTSDVSFVYDLLYNDLLKLEDPCNNICSNSDLIRNYLFIWAHSMALSLKELDDAKAFYLKMIKGFNSCEKTRPCHTLICGCENKKPSNCGCSR